MNQNMILNQIISAIRLHKQWNGGEWVYHNMTKEYVIYINNLCDEYEKILKIGKLNEPEIL